MTTILICGFPAPVLAMLCLASLTLCCAMVCVCKWWKTPL